MTNQVSVSLPQDIVIDILLLLPLESILACKCVSKQWKDLINNPEFNQLYRNKSTSLFLCKDKVYCLSTRQDDEITSDRPSFKLRRIPFMGNFLRHELHGSSNRIACVRADRHFLFYDLLTGDSHMVPDSPFSGDDILWFRYGFGYDRYADDYKIVVVCTNDICKRWLHWFEVNNFPITVQNSDCSLIFVYSFENRCWKSITGFPCAAYELYGRKQAYSFNGVLHWVLAKRGLKGAIGALDLHSYRFDVWIMKEYGVGESWTNLLSIYIGDSQIDNILCQLRPIVVYQCGDGRKLVLLVSDCPKMKLFWYDIDNDKLEKVVNETARGTLGLLRMLKSSFKAAIGAKGCLGMDI